MGNEPKKKKKKSNKVNRAKTAEKVDEETDREGAASDELKEKRLKFAKDVVDKAWREGRSLERSKNIRAVLSQEEKDRGLPEDFFSCLTRRDVRSLCRGRPDEDRSRVREKGSTPLSRQHFDSTGLPDRLPPDVSKLPSDQGYHSEERGNTEAAEPKSEASQSITTPEQASSLSNNSGEPDEFDICIFHPKKKRFTLAKAKHAQHEKSYISKRLLRRSKIYPEDRDDNAIRLDWDNTDPEKQDSKTKNTLFWILEKLNGDVVIGTGWDDSDYSETEDDCQTSDEDVSDSDDSSSESSEPNEPEDETDEVERLAVTSIRQSQRTDIVPYEEDIPTSSSLISRETSKTVGEVFAEFAVALEKRRRTSSQTEPMQPLLKQSESKPRTKRPELDKMVEEKKLPKSERQSKDAAKAGKKPSGKKKKGDG